MTDRVDRRTLPDVICHDILFQGRRIGTSWAALTETADSGFTIDCHLSLRDTPEIGLRAVRKRSRHVLSADGTPRTVSLTDSLGGAAEFSLSPRTMRVNGTAVPLAAPVEFILESNMVPLTAYQLLIRKPTRETPFTCLTPDSANILRVSFTPTDGGYVNSLGETMTTDTDGVIAGVRLAVPDFSFERASRPQPRWPDRLGQRRFEYVPPAGIDVTDVTRAGEDGAGTATVARPRTPKTPAAAAVFVGGTGAYNRHGLTPRVDLGTHQLLDDLARCGVATVRYDMPDPLAAAANAENRTDFAGLGQRAAHWLDWLAARSWAARLPRIIVGQSLGGLVALDLANRRDDVAGVVTLGAPGRNLRETLSDQDNWLQAHTGLSANGKAASARLRDAFMAALEMEEDWTADRVPAAFLPMRHQHPLLKSVLDLDPAGLAAGGRAPLLVVHGTADLQVPLSDARHLSAVARSGGRPTEMIVAEGLDHLLKRNRKSGLAAYRLYADRRRRVPIALIRRIAGGIVRMTVGRTPAR